MRSPEVIIKRPLLTEKGTLLKDTGGRAEEDITDPEQVAPQLLLEVARDANKIEIKHAVEKLWSVSVLKVRTATVRGKQKARRPLYRPPIQLEAGPGHSSPGPED